MKPGDTVVEGQKLARVGTQDEGSTMLHVETYEFGTMVDDDVVAAIRASKLRWRAENPPPCGRATVGIPRADRSGNLSPRGEHLITARVTLVLVGPTLSRRGHVHRRADGWFQIDRRNLRNESCGWPIPTKWQTLRFDTRNERCVVCRAWRSSGSTSPWPCIDISAKLHLMTTRDEFTARTKQILAERAALRCSNPDCRVLTKGPTIAPEGTQNAGCAAHIAAAAPGGPRFDQTMTSDDRKSGNNGLWLCRNCGERVDDDVASFPAELLRKWKADIELEVSNAIGKPAHLGARAAAALEWVVGGESRPRLVLSYSEVELSVERAEAARYTEEELSSMDEPDEAVARAFNRSCDEYLEGISGQERAESAWLRASDDGLEVGIQLLSTGATPLENARAFITTPEEILVLGHGQSLEDPELPSPPVRPETHPRFIGIGWIDAIPITAADIMPPFGVNTDVARHIAEAQLGRERWGLHVEDGEITGFKKHLTHNLTFTFPDRVTLIPPTIAGVFAATYEIHADNLPVPTRGELVIEVRRGSSEPPDQ